jgi:IclR family acetate operon transcriptional repressor
MAAADGETSSRPSGTDAPSGAEDPADAVSAAGSLIGRTISVIEGLLDAGEPIGPRALARTTGIDRSAVGRILQQLTELGVLERGRDGYEPGTRLFSLARVLTAQDTLPAAAAAILAGLVEELDETCYVCVLQGDSAVFLYERQSSHPIRLVVELGQPIPLNGGAAGRAILAGMSRDEAARLLGSGPLPPLTEATICDVTELLDLAEVDRARGFSVSREERLRGGLAIASPFHASSGRCQGSVVFTSPISRFDEGDTHRIGAAVGAAASALSARMGASGDA